MPIIEAAACGIPIFCRRYQPEEVYSHVIGEHLHLELRLKNIDFKDPQLNKDIVESVKQHLFSPISFEKNREHNRYVIEKRYSFEALTDEFKHIIYKLYLQIQSNHKPMDRAKKAFRKYETHLENNKVYTKDIMNTSNRQYLAGYGQMAFMIFLKSLIDPSYFRTEEKRIRGMAMQFAEELVDSNPNLSPIPVEINHKFYNSVVSLFHLREGEIPVRMDHSFAYRHRNKIKYLYREYTPQELTGVINILFKKHISSPTVTVINKMDFKTIHDDPCFYDMLYQNQEIPGNGRILVRMAGNIIKDIIATHKGQNIPVLPVGLTLSFPQNKFPKSWEENTTLNIQMIGWPDYDSAIEAGPQHLDNGKVCIDMDIEGWKTLNSIRTQAARLDYLDSRGPKIAIGLHKNGDLLIITINGRIRESVGATHHDIANIMKSRGIRYAMGFDPGGSSTLVIDGKTLNISPYNHRYEEDVYYLPPEPRAVANAVLLSEINGKE